MTVVKWPPGFNFRYTNADDGNHNHLIINTVQFVFTKKGYTFLFFALA